MRSQTKAKSDAEGAQTLLSAVKLLVEGIARHSVRGEIDEFNSFRRQIQRVLQSLDEGRLPDETLDAAGEAVNLLKDYGHRTSKRLRQEGIELHAIIKMLLDTFRDLAIAGPEKMRELQDVGSALASASDGDKLAQYKGTLSECLGEIQREAERFRPDANGRTIGDSRIDQLTGLGGREVAEAALVTACAAESPGCAIIIILDRIAVYNVRFGRAVGDRVLQFFANHLGQNSPFGIPPFRWSGPSLLLLCPAAAEQAAHVVRRVLEQRIEYEVELDARTILLPIAARWEVVPMMVDARLVVNKIDSIVAFQGIPGPHGVRTMTRRGVSQAPARRSMPLPPEA